MWEQAGVLATKQVQVPSDAGAADAMDGATPWLMGTAGGSGLDLAAEGAPAAIVVLALLAPCNNGAPGGLLRGVAGAVVGVAASSLTPSLAAGLGVVAFKGGNFKGVLGAGAPMVAKAAETAANAADDWGCAPALPDAWGFAPGLPFPSPKAGMPGGRGLKTIWPPAGDLGAPVRAIRTHSMDEPGDSASRSAAKA